MSRSSLIPFAEWRSLFCCRVEARPVDGQHRLRAELAQKKVTQEYLTGALLELRGDDPAGRSPLERRTASTFWV